MQLMLSARVVSLASVIAVVFAACGGKTVDLDGGPTTPADTSDAAPETSPPTTFDAGGRICPSNCTVGHQCCKGGCGGIPAAMPSSCCSCLPGEVDSMQCTNGKCGG
jgi:hypothetical protein